jgi:DNA ligase (NAD+)
MLRELEQLSARLTALDAAYYGGGRSEASDSEYDAMAARAEQLRRQLNVPESTSVGSAPRVPRDHVKPMLSLERARDDAQLARFVDNVQKAADTLGSSSGSGSMFVLERKYDGLAAALRFDSSATLVSVLTRGDGVAGDDVTDAARRFIDPSAIAVLRAKLPPYLRGAPFEVRGEVVLPRRLATVLSPRGTATARNVAAGLLMRKLENDDGESVDSEKARESLQFRCFGLVTGEAVPLARYSEMCALLRDVGLAPCDWAHAVGDVDEVRRLWRGEGERLRRESEFDMDGLVLKVDSFALQAALGERSRSPRWAIALKFDAEQCVTSVTDVRLHVGRFGTVTPVASVAPVTIGGASLTRASLHHLGRAFALGLYPFGESARGASVLLERGGDVIPHVVARADGVPPRAPLDADCNALIAAAAPPPVCPCALATSLEPHGPNQWRCSGHERCPERAAARRLHLCRTLGLEHVADRSLAQLVELGVVRCDADVLRLAALRQRVLRADGTMPGGWGDRKWARLVSQLDARIAERSLELRQLAERFDSLQPLDAAAVVGARTVPLWRAIAAVGAEHVGQAVSRGIATRLSTFGNFVALFVGDDEARATATLLECEGVGDVGAAKIWQHMRQLLASVDGRDLLYTLSLMAADETVAAVGGGSETTAVRFAVTGSLKTLSRKELAEQLAARGGVLLSDVSAQAAFLVVADAARGNSAKRRKASELGVQVMSESDLMQWLASGDREILAGKNESRRV